MALARSAGSGNSVTMMAMITEADRAPPIPWTKRPATSMAGLTATPQMTEATVKDAIPAKKTSLRPIRSPRRPAISRKLANVIKKASTTQISPDWLKCRSRESPGAPR